MSAMGSLAEAVAFFTDNAGTSYNPATETPEEGATRGAWALTLAELWADHVGASVVWADDWEIGHHGDYYGPGSAYDPDNGGSEPTTCEVATLVGADGDVVDGLGCIDDATGAYRRVVAAELALEACPEAVTAGVRSLEDVTTCGTCGLLYGPTTPAGRCPLEADHDEQEDDEPAAPARQLIIELSQREAVELAEAAKVAALSDRSLRLTIHADSESVSWKIGEGMWTPGYGFAAQGTGRQ